MAKFRLEVLKKVSDPALVEAELAAITTFPKYVVVKKPTINIVEYWICKPFVGDQFDRVADQIYNAEVAEHTTGHADFATAVAARAGIVDGMIIEQANVDATFDTYADDDQYTHDQIAEKKNPPNVGGHRAEEGWAPPSQIKPSGQAFNDSQKGVAGAAEAGFGKELG